MHVNLYVVKLFPTEPCIIETETAADSAYGREPGEEQFVFRHGEDHAGGLDSLGEAWPAAPVYSDSLAPAGWPVQPCESGLVPRPRL